MWLLKQKKKKSQIKLKFKSKPIQQLFNLPPQNLETSEQKKSYWKRFLFVKKAPLQRQDFQPVKSANM